nr:peroxisomal acyl-coenzyme A oxidase 2 isoform X2 [Vicugna pacos]
MLSYVPGFTCPQQRPDTAQSHPPEGGRRAQGLPEADSPPGTAFTLWSSPSGGGERGLATPERPRPAATGARPSLECRHRTEDLRGAQGSEQPSQKYLFSDTRQIQTTMGSPVHRVSLGDTWSKQVHPDIQSERHMQSFDVEQLTKILDGGAQNTALRRKVESIIHSDPEFSLKDNYFMTQNERYEAACKKKFHIQMLAQRLGWSEDSRELGYAYRSLSGDLALGIHNIFLKSIRSLGSEEQIAKWAPLCNKFQIIATYAQTELGHGTYLQGLETEATYDAATQEFVVHSPTMTAIKWWPGGLGRSATHALVLAQLICSGARQGMHAFIVPIRSLQDHSPLPGITVGDIGPKMDFDDIDNGFLQLDRVRIPRENMLSRFAQVLPDGTYIKLGTAKANYLTMVVTRVDILLGEVIPMLEKACVIAIRYSVVRRQSRIRPSDPEAKVLDYQTQQQKLLPQLATAYAFHFLASSLLEFFHRSYSSTLDKDFSLLPELHALSAGAKAMVTDFCAQGVELCRRACGGHGYSKLSGLPSLVTRVAASCTYEGENTVLYLQTARSMQLPARPPSLSLDNSINLLTGLPLPPCPTSALSPQAAGGSFSKPREDHILPLLEILQWLPQLLGKCHSPHCGLMTWPLLPLCPLLTSASHTFLFPLLASLPILSAPRLLYSCLLLTLQVSAQMTPPRTPSVTTPPRVAPSNPPTQHCPVSFRAIMTIRKRLFLCDLELLEGRESTCLVHCRTPGLVQGLHQEAAT